VQHDGQRFRSPDKSVTNFDVIAVFDLRAEICTRPTVHGDATFRDQLVAVPARAESRGGKEAIEAHGALKGGEMVKRLSDGMSRQRFIALPLQRLDVGLRLGQANDLARLFPLATLLEQLDPFEPFQDVALCCDGAGAFETAMLRHKFCSEL